VNDQRSQRLYALVTYCATNVVGVVGAVGAPISVPHTCFCLSPCLAITSCSFGVVVTNGPSPGSSVGMAGYV
jgi:hypothetical protein